MRRYSDGKDGGEAAGSYPLVAVCIDKDMNSQNALKYATETLVHRGQTLVLVHVNNRGISGWVEDAAGYKQPVDPKIKDLFLPFRCFCFRKNILSKKVVLDGHDVAKSIMEFAAHAAIEKIVLGANTRSSFVRFKADIPSSITKTAPDFSTVYVVTKGGKVSSVRQATRQAPSVSPLRTMILGPKAPNHAHTQKRTPPPPATRADTAATRTMQLQVNFIMAAAAAAPAAASVVTPAAQPHPPQGGNAGTCSSSGGGMVAQQQAEPPRAEPPSEAAEGERDQDKDRKGKKKVVFDVCKGNHWPSRCRLPRQPKPVATLCGFGVDGRGFYAFSSSNFAKVIKEFKSAVIKVIGGTLTPEQLIKELKRIVPVDDWEWEVQDNGNNTYIVPFPSVVELERLIHIEEVNVRAHGIVLQFSKGDADSSAKYALKNVWVQVYGVPSKIHDFSNLWAVGTLIGVTQTVDMVYTRKKGVVRLRVAILDPALISERVEIVVDCKMYDIFFKLEPEQEVEGGDDDSHDADIDDSWYTWGHIDDRS